MSNSKKNIKGAEESISTSESSNPSYAMEHLNIQ
jgi:hypothetical protein